MTECKVWLDNYYTGQYYPGNHIQGRIVLNFSSETTLRNVKIRLLGQERTKWMGTESYSEVGSNETKTRQVLFEGANDFLSNEIILYGPQTGTTVLSAGQHIYPFTVVLPIQIPASYNSENGSITYKIKAIVDRPMAFDYTDELIFVLLSPVDLNHLGNPQLLELTSYSDEKTVCCLCCAQGPISMDVSLPKRTLVPGETVNITVRLSNLSNTNIEGLEFELIQKITYTVETPHYEDSFNENTLISLNEVGLGAHGEHTYTFPVSLPANFPIPNFTLCKLFKVEYIYEVTAKLPGVHSDLSIKMYPHIGNIEIGQRTPVGVGYQNYPPYSGNNFNNPPGPGQYYQQPNFPGINPALTEAQEAANPSAPLLEDELLPPSYDSLQPTKY